MIVDKKEIYTKLLHLCMKDYAYRDEKELNSKSLLALMKYCIDNGANVDSTNSNGETLLCIACETGIQVVKLLVEAGADVNLKGCSVHPIHVAIACNEFEVVKCLLEHGADVNVKNVYGDTPLDRLYSRIPNPMKSKLISLLESYAKKGE